MRSHALGFGAALLVVALLAEPASAFLFRSVGRGAARGVGRSLAGKVDDSLARSAAGKSVKPAVAETAGSARWIDQGVRRVPLTALPKASGAGVLGASAKASPKELRSGIRELTRMQRAIDSGRGSSTAYWRALDRKAGRSYANGRQRIYESYYGPRAIRVEKVGDRYVVTNGHHRLEAAREMGISDLPMHVVESVPKTGGR